MLKSWTLKNPSTSSLPLVLSWLGMNRHRQHSLPGSPGAGIRHRGLLWKGQVECGWHRTAGGGRRGEGGEPGESCTVPRQREPALCTHRSLCQLRDSCAFPFPEQNALHEQIRCLWCPRCRHTEPLGLGWESPALSRHSASGNRGRNPTRAWSSLSPARLSCEPPSAERAGRAEGTWQLPGAQESPDLA